MYEDGKTIKFEIATPERIVCKEEIKRATIPTRSGEITILPKHTPLVSILAPGVIEIKKKVGGVSVMSVSGGFVEVLRNKVVILADTAERAEEIDLARADEARRRAEESKKNIKQFDKERFAGINAAIAKELARAKAVKKWKKIKA